MKEKMTAIQLKDVANGSLIDVSKEKITIGRGPHLKVTDKRVSRHHATLHINDKGQLVLVPIHINPCFFKEGEGGYVTLEKDKPCILHHKNIFALLPDACAFEVLYKSSEKDLVRNNGDSVDLEKYDTTCSTSTLDMSKHPELAQKILVKNSTKHEMAMPLEKSRNLPKWMVGAASRCGSQPSKATSTCSKPRIAKTLKSPSKSKESAEEEEKKPDKRKVKEERGKKNVRAEEDREIITTRRRRAAAGKAKKTSDDFVVSDEEPSDDEEKDDDSDFKIDDDSGSDYTSTKKNKGRGKGTKSVRNEKSRGSKRNKKRKIISESEEEDDFSDEEYTTKKRGTAKPRGKRKTKRNISDLESDSEQFDSYVPKPSNKKPRKAQVKDDSGNGSDADEQPAKIKHKDISSNESDADSDATKKKKMVNKSDSDSESQPKKKAKKKSAREKCMYGEKCYRKNPKHFEEFCHPGDDSYTEEEEEEEIKPKRARRAATKKDKMSVLAGASDDDGDINTYDYDDSFLDDVELSSKSSSNFGEEETDSDWEPDDSEDVKNLVKEAKSFMKNKKMVKPAKRK